MCFQSTKAKPYVPPFEGMVDNDPALEEMKRVVCDENRRPPIEKAWREADVTLAFLVSNRDGSESPPTSHPADGGMLEHVALLSPHRPQD